MGTFADDPVANSPSFGADDELITPVGAGDNALRGLVSGGGAALNALDSLQSMMNPAHWASQLTGVPEPGDVAGLVNDADAYSKIQPNEIPSDDFSRGMANITSLPAGLAEAGATLGSGMVAPVMG
ncbi:MAG: hypothetical protein ACREPX_12440, partial [Rhodanobacteraceae bacterium]